MTSESKTWQQLKAHYLGQVEKALASVRHPRARDVLEDVGAHLDRRRAELAPEQQTAENLRAIIADMGPPADYAELLEPDGAAARAGVRARPIWWGALAGAVVMVLAVVVIVAVRGAPRPPDRVAGEKLAAEAWSVWRQRKFSQAEMLFAQAVEKDPTNANAWNGLGWAQFNQGKSATAATSFRKCLEIEPAHAAALNGLGWIAKNDGRANEAIDYWQRAVEALPSATAALAGLATTYMETQQYDKAVEVYEKWLRVDPDNAKVKADLEEARTRLATAHLSSLPQLIAQLSDPEATRFVALNKVIQIGAPAVPMLIEQMRTSTNWQIPKALGAIGDKRAVLPLIEKLEATDLEPMRKVVGEALTRITGQKLGVSPERWRAWWREQAGPSADADGSGAIYIVTFKPVAPFAPQTARELLEAFNEKHPPGVRTHHYRTRVEDRVLVGSICVDTEAGKDAVVAMLSENATLTLVEAVRATPEALKRLYDRGQPSLSSSGSRRPSRRVREPTTSNRTVTRPGTWPPGDCVIYGAVSRRARLSRVDHAKVCLSSDAYGSWVVEAEDHGRVDFKSIPAGTYRLYTKDTSGYRDTYYNPSNQDSDRPTFELRAGDVIRPHLQIEPVGPYRKTAGRVLDEDGTAPADCNGLTVSAWVQRPQGSWKGYYRVLARSAVQADGSYVLDELDGRPVYVQVRDSRPPVQVNPYPPRFHPGTFSRPQAALVTFGEASLVEGVDIAMASSGGLAIAGLVTERESGQPVAQALVTIFHHDMFFDLFYTYTDEQGRYRLEGLGEGKFIVHVDAVHQGYVKTRKIAVVKPDAVLTQLDFTLRPGANISGTVVDETGQPYHVGRGFGNASRRRGGFAARASNFPYGNMHAPEFIRRGSTVFCEEGEGDVLGTTMVFPTETSFLLPAVAPGDVLIRFRPRGRGESVTKILYEGRDILKTGLKVEPCRSVTGIGIIVARPRAS
ncbi:MAG: tetratricopeptide repeat protein [Phycisphaerales bacterium]|nr:MAG: tetratricopeptide repeat protein [Phycisphaerales bacterium]